MAITRVGVGAQAADLDPGPITAAFPASYTPVAGDFAVCLLVGISGTSGSEPAAPTGWTHRSSHWRGNTVSFATYYRVLDGTESAPQFTAPAAWSNSFSAQMAVYRGVDSTNPFDVADVLSDAGLVATFQPTGLTTVTDGAMVCSAVCSGDDNALDLNTANGFTGAMTGAAYDTTVGTDSAVGLADKIQATAGAVSCPVWEQTTNPASDVWAAITFALRPAPAGSGATATPGTGALTLTGLAPTVLTPRQVIPGLGQLTVTGLAPTVLTPRQVRPAAGQIVLTGFAPAVTVSVSTSPGTGALALTGFAPTVLAPRTVLPGLGSLALTGFAPAVLISTLAQPGTGALTLTGFAPAVVVTDHQRVTPDAGALLLEGYAPTILVGGEVLRRRAIGGFRRVLYEPAREPERKREEPPPTPEAAPLPEPPQPPARLRTQPRVTDPVRAVRLPKVDMAVLLDAEDEELLIHLLAVLLD